MTNYSRSVLLSNGHRRPKIRLKKFSFSPKIVPADIVKKLPSQRCSQPFLIAFFNFSHKRPTFAFTSESVYTLSAKNRTQRLTRRNTGRFGWDRYHYPRSVPHVHKHPRAGCQNGELCRFKVLAGVLPKNTESLRNSDALMRVAVPKASRPRWAA